MNQSHADVAENLLDLLLQCGSSMPVMLNLLCKHFEYLEVCYDQIPCAYAMQTIIEPQRHHCTQLGYISSACLCTNKKKPCILPYTQSTETLVVAFKNALQDSTAWAYES
jgi:hypothetical protein